MDSPLLRNVSLRWLLGAGLLLGGLPAGCGQTAQRDVPPGMLRGTLRMRVASFEDRAETRYRLVTNDETIELSFADKAPPVAPLADVIVGGIREGNKLRVDRFEVVKTEGEQTEALAPAKRTLKIALISVDSTYMPARGKQRLLTAADSPAAFYRDNSYGDWTIEGDAFGPFSISIPNCNDSELDPIAMRATAAAQAAGMDPSQYDNFMFMMPASAGCLWGGIAEVGTNPTIGFKNGKNTWYRGDGCVVFAQELGHNFGLLHSHSCTSPPYASQDYGNGACAGFSEYGDRFTPMGGGCGHFNAPELGHMGFISGCNTIEVAANGMFEIGPIETRCDGPQVLRVPGAADVNQGPQFIYAEYRRGMGTVGSDTRSTAGVYLHASAAYGGNLTNTVDPDTRYAVDPFTIHAALTAGQQWTEPTSGVTFHVVSAGATATVELTFAAGGGAAPKCSDGSAPPAAPKCGSVGDGGAVDGAGGAGGAGGRIDGGAGAMGSGGRSGSGGQGGTVGGGGAGAGGGVGVGGGGTNAGSGGGAGVAGGAGSAGSSIGGNGSTGSGRVGAPAAEDSGCGCRVAHAATGARLAWCLVALGALLARRLRRKSPRARLRQIFRCEIDHRSSATSTQADRTGATLLGKADWHRPRGPSPCIVTLPASPGRHLAKTAAIADRDLLLPKTVGVVLGSVFRPPAALKATRLHHIASQDPSVPVTEEL
jgi:hypothetical protein